MLFFFREILTPKAREKDGELYCLRCHDNAASICGGCRRPIEGRIIHALTRTWHPEVGGALGVVLCREEELGVVLCREE